MQQNYRSNEANRLIAGKSWLLVLTIFCGVFFVANTGWAQQGDGGLGNALKTEAQIAADFRAFYSTNNVILRIAHNIIPLPEGETYSIICSALTPIFQTNGVHLYGCGKGDGYQNGELTGKKFAGDIADAVTLTIFITEGMDDLSGYGIKEVPYVQKLAPFNSETNLAVIYGVTARMTRKGFWRGSFNPQFGGFDFGQFGPFTTSNLYVSLPYLQEPEAFKADFAKAIELTAGRLAERIKKPE